MRTACRITALALLLAAGLPSAGLACEPVGEDVLVTSDPGDAAIRPRECASVEQNPPDFAWPHFGNGPYAVNLVFPDGHIESRTAEHNWLNWNATLPAGDYSWSVTRAGDTSEPRRFTVGRDAVPFVVPDMNAVIDHLLATPRPRGLPDDATFARMRSQRPFALETLRGFVDFRLGEPLPPAGNAGDGHLYDSYGMRALWSLMAYVYDGTDIYREDARRRVLNLASWHPRGPTSIDDLESQFVAWVLTLGYDWLEPVLAPAEKDLILSHLGTRIGDLYHWIIGVHGWPPDDPGSKKPAWQWPRISHRNLATAMVPAMSALLVGELPQARTWLRELLPFALNVTSPWSGEEGGYANGTSSALWDVGALLSSWYVLRWATCGSEQTCIDLAQKAWVRNYGRFLAYFVPPTFAADLAALDERRADPGTPIGLFGDGFAETQLFEQRARFAEGYAHFAPSGLACWYASALAGEDQIAIEYLMSPPDTCAATPEFPSATPDALYLPTTGWIGMHSDLSELERTSVYFKSSPRPFAAFNHQSADHNAFVINAGGERLAIESGYYFEHGGGFSSEHWQYWVKRTRSKNAITFDGGQGQVAVEHPPNAFQPESFRYGSIIQQESTLDYDIVTGDATHAYNGALTRAVRSLVYLRPGTILVYDNLASDTPRTWEWNIHALDPFDVISSESRVRIARRGQSLCIDMLAGPPRQFTPISTPDFSSWGRSNDPANDVSAAPSDPDAAVQYHGKFASTQPSTTAEFIALLRVNAACDDAAPEAVKKGEGAWMVRVGDSIITIVPNSDDSIARVRTIGAE
ncbi:MAG: heparinase II/III domain-containing protein, partial [Burkholderiales bacterium]